MESRRLNEWKRPARVLAVSLAGALALSVAATAAQDTSSDTVRPASIHLGSCDAPGEAVAELNDLVVMFDDNDDDQGGGSDAGTASTPAPGSGTGDDNADDGTGGDNADDGLGGDDNADDGTGDDNADDGPGGDDADDGTGDDDADDGDDSGDDGSRPGIRAFQASGGEFVGPEDASVVEGSEDSNIGTDLATLLAEPHVIAVFESEGSDTIIACGSIGGFASADDDTDLAVGLREQNDSGFAGIALLDDDDDDNELDVDVYIGRDVAAN
ncbi:MAG: hypothetical protein M3457_21335 [Chloroflexota bacterium]|nr:hypothetical protein [Chloroflexota bacterium]